MMPSSAGPHTAARPGAHPVTVTIDAGHPGPVVPDDFAGLSFERGPLNPGNAGVSGNLFSPVNNSLITLFRNLGLGSLRIGGGTVDQLIPAGTGSDGLTGIDNLFAFAAAAGVKVIYSLRLLSPAADPIGDLKAVHAQAAGHIWRHYQQNVASFAIGIPSQTSYIANMFLGVNGLRGVGVDQKELLLQPIVLTYDDINRRCRQPSETKYWLPQLFYLSSEFLLHCSGQGYSYPADS